MKVLIVKQFTEEIQKRIEEYALKFNDEVIYVTDNKSYFTVTTNNQVVKIHEVSPSTWHSVVKPHHIDLADVWE